MSRKAIRAHRKENSVRRKQYFTIYEEPGSFTYPTQTGAPPAISNTTTSGRSILKKISNPKITTSAPAHDDEMPFRLYHDDINWECLENYISPNSKQPLPQTYSKPADYKLNNSVYSGIGS